MIFECVGVPGILDEVIASAPLLSRVVVVGVCMKPDRIRPAMAINKEINLRFVVGYTPLEFRDTLHALADGKVNAGAIVTGTVGLPGVERAFDALGDPESHAEDPGSTQRFRPPSWRRRLSDPVTSSAFRPKRYSDRQTASRASSGVG